MLPIMVMQRQELRVQQQHALLLTQEMRQSIQVLQLPITELSQWLEDQLELNPALERVERVSGVFRKEVPLETPYCPSLFQVLMEQARLELEGCELETAEWIIGNLDERGFFSLPLPDEQLPILNKIQELGPPGIAARDLRECLLLQLEKKSAGLAYRLVRDHMEDLVHNRLEKIVKKLGCSRRALKEVVRREILSLDFCPAAQFSIEYVPVLIPDLIVDKQGDSWITAVNEEGLPMLHLSSQSMLCLTKVQAGRHLIEALERRKSTLQKIAKYLVQKMPEFFEGSVTYPQPLTMKEVAAELGLHESTIARAVSGKAIQCIQGVLSMRSFFTSSLQNAEGQTVSNEQAKQLLKMLIGTENKAHPLSDEALAEMMAAKGIACARRTVTKYRKLLKIPTAALRRKYRESGASANSFDP